MCGRYSIAVEPALLEERFGAHFGATLSGDIVPRYNAAPSQMLPVILNADPGHIVFSRWGIAPAWMSRLSGKDGLINVRFETLRDRPTFRADLASRRCLILADGFYEWSRGNMVREYSPLPSVARDFTPRTSSIEQKESRLEAVPRSKRKVPYRITRADGEAFAFAGIWEEDSDKGASPRFAIITTAADAFMQPIHSRMPVILDVDEERAGLSVMESFPISCGSWRRRTPLRCALIKFRTR